MSIEQVQAAIRAGIEIGESLDGNAVGCAGIGVGSPQSAALVLSALSEVPVWDFLDAAPSVPEGLLDHTVLVLESARQRHIELTDPIEQLAALGGFEVAMMVGLMLSAAARRFVVIPDGLPACAALLVASALAPGGCRVLRPCAEQSASGVGSRALAVRREGWRGGQNACH
jgi:nicotinate-nucleotide--dimethylbenzimidazole phosphoribosyltransferase